MVTTDAQGYSTVTDLTEIGGDELISTSASVSVALGHTAIPPGGDLATALLAVRKSIRQSDGSWVLAREGLSWYLLAIKALARVRLVVAVAKRVPRLGVVGIAVDNDVSAR